MPTTDIKPTALQRLAVELKTFDWHHDPKETDSKAARQEAKIRKLIEKCKPEEVWDLWDLVAPGKFPTPFGLKPRKKVKTKPIKGLPVHPNQAFARREKLGLPDPSGEVQEWAKICALVNASEKLGVSPFNLVKDKAKLKELGIDKNNATQEIAERAEWELKQMAAERHKFQDIRLSHEFNSLVDYLDRGETTIDDLTKVFGRYNAQRIASELQRKRATALYEGAAKASTNGAAKAEAGGTNAAKPTKAAKAPGVQVPAGGSLHVAYTGPDGKTYGNVRHFEDQAKADAFFRRIGAKGRNPYFSDASGKRLGGPATPEQAKPAKNTAKPAKEAAKAPAKAPKKAPATQTKAKAAPKAKAKQKAAGKAPKAPSKPAPKAKASK